VVLCTAKLVRVKQRRPFVPDEQRHAPEARSDGADAQAHELGLIQTIGRRAAEACTPDELFGSTVAALLRGSRLELAGVAHRLDDDAELLAYPARPFAADALERLREMAGRLLHGVPDRLPRLRRVELDLYDPAQASLERCDEKELIVVPLMRGDRPVAYLIALPAPDARETQLRLLYAAANQLSLHLERILTARETEADRFRSIVESMPQAVVLTDARLEIVQANRSASALLERLGLPTAGSLRPVAERFRLQPLLDQVRSGQAVLADDEIVVDVDRVFQVTVTPLAGRGASPSGLVVVLADVTESRRLQQRLAHAEKMTSLGLMISGVAHELNNPLATILGSSQLMQATSKDPALAQRMQVLSHEAQRCSKIVENLLSFARRREPESKPISLNDVVRSVERLMRYQLRVEDVTLETELNPDLPVVQADAHQLQQVLVNLVTNARHAIEQTGEAGWIWIATMPGPDGGARLEVRDSGVGIEESIRSKIFDPFFSTKPEGQGTGLGLSIVYGIVTAHGGTIEAGPRQGGGSVIRITLPRASTAVLPEAAARTEGTTPQAGPARILVVDDEQPFAQVICEALAHDGHHAEAAADGRDALGRLRTKSFDLVISDLKMPGMDGASLHDSMERLEPGLGRRLLLTTGDTVSEAAAALDARLGVAVLRKPFALDRLRAAVNEALARVRDDTER